ncbi:hypothetical protein FI667_g2507, partial [Globisporangium splendens]
MLIPKYQKDLERVCELKNKCGTFPQHCSSMCELRKWLQFVQETFVQRSNDSQCDHFYFDPCKIPSFHEQEKAGDPDDDPGGEHDPDNSCNTRLDCENATENGVCVNDAEEYTSNGDDDDFVDADEGDVTQCDTTDPSMSKGEATGIAIATQGQLRRRTRR